MLFATRPLRVAVLAALGATATTATTADTLAAVDSRRDVDLVIALDVSGSMEGLIDSAKQRLWDITNELAQARPTPNLRVAILSYGSPSYGEQTGFVHLDLPFTSDLDAVSATLFAFQTDGGDEYVSRAIQTSLDTAPVEPRHRRAEDRVRRRQRIGRARPADHDRERYGAAARRGIVVNAIYCGTDGDADSRAWRRLATNTNGLYASIDQNAAAVANVATPFDAPLAALNDKLNETYIALGSDGERGRENLVRRTATRPR